MLIKVLVADDHKLKSVITFWRFCKLHLIYFRHLLSKDPSQVVSRVSQDRFLVPSFFFYT